MSAVAIDRLEADKQAAQAFLDKQAARLPAGGEGLVPFSTSFQGQGVIEIDRLECRLSRMRSGVFTAARLISKQLEGKGYQPWMLTLTYRPGDEWKPHHISDCVKSLRGWAKDYLFKLRYIWVAEIQEGRWQKGESLLGECVHYHLLVWIPSYLEPPKLDQAGFWPWGMTQRIRVKAPLRYITKYTSKGSDIGFPKGLRISGVGGLTAADRNHRTWWLMPRWVRTIWNEQEKPRRASGGGIISRLTGEWLPSIWKVSLTGGAVFIQLRNDISKFFSSERLNLLQAAGLNWRVCL